jgi:flagellar protein FlbD
MDGQHCTTSRTSWKSDLMIAVTRLNGSALALNPSLIERIERTPDTVLSLTTGTKYVVHESMEDVLEKIVAFQASVIVMAERMRLQLQQDTDFALHVIHGDRED